MVKPDLFEDFAGDGFGGGFVGIGPAAGEGPEVVLGFANEEDVVVAEDHAADIDLGGGVAGLGGEDAGDGFDRFAGAGGHDLRGDIADGFVALAVIVVFGEEEAVLGDGLEFPGPFEPGGAGMGQVQV